MLACSSWKIGVDCTAFHIDVDLWRPSVPIRIAEQTRRGLIGEHLSFQRHPSTSPVTSSNGGYESKMSGPTPNEIDIETA